MRQQESIACGCMPACCAAALQPLRLPPALACVQHQIAAGPPGGAVHHRSLHRAAQRLAEEAAGVQQLCGKGRGPGGQRGRRTGTTFRGRRAGLCLTGCAARAPWTCLPACPPALPPAPGPSWMRRTEPPCLKLLFTQALCTTQPCGRGRRRRRRIRGRVRVVFSRHALPAVLPPAPTKERTRLHARVPPPIAASYLAHGSQQGGAGGCRQLGGAGQQRFACGRVWEAAGQWRGTTLAGHALSLKPPDPSHRHK